MQLACVNTIVKGGGTHWATEELLEDILKVDVSASLVLSRSQANRFFENAMNANCKRHPEGEKQQYIYT